MLVSDVIHYSVFYLDDDLYTKERYEEYMIYKKIF